MSGLDPDSAAQLLPNPANAAPTEGTDDVSSRTPSERRSSLSSSSKATFSLRRVAVGASIVAALAAVVLLVRVRTRATTLSGALAGLMSAYQEEVSLEECRRDFLGKACCWTQAWSCPNQPLGKKGKAMNDASREYQCCCNHRLWDYASNCSEDLIPKQISLPDDKFLWGRERATHESGRCEDQVGKQLRGEFQEAEPSGCKIPVHKYNASEEIQKLCRNKEEWHVRADTVRPRMCPIDPVTKLMTCTRDQICFAGEYVAERYVVVTKNLTYDCSKNCKGALLISCCNACLAEQKRAEQWGNERIVCEGCDNAAMTATVDQTEGCSIKDGKFGCDTGGVCTASPTEVCEEAHHTCDIFPCDSCSVPHLQAHCCAHCLDLMCSADPKRRLLCKGCEDPSMAGEQPWAPMLPFR